MPHHARAADPSPQGGPERLAGIARAMAMPEDHVAREILQARIVGHLFAARVGREVMLKGGLGMQLHGSRRRTKDIDLHSGPHVPCNRTQSLVRQAIKAALADGLITRAEWSEPKQTETVQRWKVRGFAGETPVNLTVELSRRGRVPDADREMVEWRPDPALGERPVLVDTYTMSGMAAAKVGALLDPKRAAPRDLYDLDLMIRAEVAAPIAQLARLPRAALVEMRDRLPDKVELLDHAAAREALLDFLPEGDADAIDPEAWAGIQARTYATIDDWLGRAIARHDAAFGADAHEAGTDFPSPAMTR